MSMNIKSEKAHRLAEELATLTGQSMTAVVTEALEEKLKRIRNKGMADRIMKIARESAALLNGEPLPDHGELLYDENGLPK